MKPIISVDSLSKSFPRRSSRDTVRAVDHVSFEVEAGEIMGLLGPNGAGKTTTIKMICALLTPDHGRVTVNGVDNQLDRSGALSHISAVLEGNRNLYWRLTARENLEYFAGNRGRSRRDVKDDIERLLAQFNLTNKADELVNGLSRGMQQKLAIAVALLADTEVILLDEPTLGLDVETGYEVRDLLRGIAREGRTILLSTHDMSVVQDLCRRTVIINDGRVVVNDEVSKLLRLFNSRAYSVELAALPSGRQMARLKEAFPDVQCEFESGRAMLRIDLDRAGDIYELVDILRSERTPIEAIDRTTIDFEQVFRRLVNGAAAAEERARVGS